MERIFEQVYLPFWFYHCIPMLLMSCGLLLLTASMATDSVVAIFVGLFSLGYGLCIRRRRGSR